MSSVLPSWSFQSNVAAMEPLIFAALDRAEFVEDDFAAVGLIVGPLVERRDVPEIEVVDFGVREPEAALVRVIGPGDARLLLDLLHGPLAGDVGAGGGAQGPQVRLAHLRAGDVEVGERLAVDLDRDLFGAGSDLHLGRQGEGRRAAGRWRVSSVYFTANERSTAPRSPRRLAARAGGCGRRARG